MIQEHLNFNLMNLLQILKKLKVIKKYIQEEIIKMLKIILSKNMKKKFKKYYYNN